MMKPKDPKATYTSGSMFCYVNGSQIRVFHRTAMVLSMYTIIHIPSNHAGFSPRSSKVHVKPSATHFVKIVF